MGVELTPNGTYGAGMPSVPRPLRKIMSALLNVFIKLQGGHIFKLMTTGAKSGKQYSTFLWCFSDGEDAWLIAASDGGAAKHPAWYFNLARNPDQVWIEVDGRKLQVQAESLKGTAYDKAWNRIAAEAPNYGTYREKTDRQIPVIRLTPKV